MTTLVQYQDPTDTSRDYSPIIWGDCPFENIRKTGNGVALGSDFNNFGGLVTSNVGNYFDEGGRYVSYEDTGGSIANIATEIGGVLTFTTDTTDNDENWLMPGGAASVAVKIADASGSAFPLWFECRVKATSITLGNWFVGLSEEGCAVADTITDSGAMVDKDWIGFRCLEAGSSLLDVAYKKNGQTVQQLIASAQTLVAGTYYKLGFVYRPAADDSKKITFYINGAPQTTYVTATQIATATFPDDEELHFLAGHKNSTGAATGISLDWWRLAQHYGG